MTKKEKQIENFLNKKKTVNVEDIPASAVEVKPKKRKLPVSDVKKENKIGYFQQRRILPAALFLVVAVLLGTSGYFYYQYKKLTADDATKNEAANYTARIGKFMVLPEGEVPTLATVADKEKLSGQSFFAGAQNGDKVLFFVKAQKAILYRPSENMIIEATSMAGAIPSGDTQNASASQNTQNANAQNPVETKQEPVAEQQLPSEDQKTEPMAAEAPKLPKVAVYNGTDKKGLAKTIADKISQEIGADIATTGNAKGNYEKTIVVDISGNNSEFVQKIVDVLGGEAGEFPQGEIKTDADIVVICGNGAVI